MADMLSSVLAYIDKMPSAQSGAGGHNATLQVALAVRRFGLGGNDAWQAMSWFNDNRCNPKWTEKELRHKLDSVAELPIKKKLGQSGAFKPRADKKFTPRAAPVPVVDTRPVIQRGEQAEELWWAKWCADHGTTLEEFDARVGNA